MPEPLPLPRDTSEDPVIEALIKLARSALRNRADRRRTMTVVDGGKRGGEAR